MPWREFVPAADPPELEVHRLGVHGEDLRPDRRRRSLRRRSCGRRSDRCSRCCSATRAFPMPRRTTATSSEPFGRLHPTKAFPVHLAARASAPSRSSCSFFSLGLVIDALITTRILVQFIGQIGALTLVAQTRCGASWHVSDVAVSSAKPGRACGMDLRVRDIRPAGHPVRAGTLVAGVLVFGVWSWRAQRWPFRTALA